MENFIFCAVLHFHSYFENKVKHFPIDDFAHILEKSIKNNIILLRKYDCVCFSYENGNRQKMEVRVKCRDCDETYIEGLKLLRYIFKCSQHGKYNYPNLKFEEIIEDLVKA